MSASPPKQGRTGIFRSVPTGFLKITLLAGISYCAIPVTEANAQAPAKHHSTTKKSASKVAAPVQQPVPATSSTPATAASTITRVQKKDLQQVESVRSEHVTVTGSLLHDPNVNSMSPITHISRADMARRGFANVTDALQALSSNGAGSLTNAFSANGAFAGGASAPSLRGLSSDSTLVLMDGQRLSYYPLSDDGQRNFVDTNWIPSSIMESTDVLEDGAATRYGADAVAGVINYVTRKEIKGFEGNAEGGLSQRGDSGHQKLYATYGFGDLRRDGYNVYINSEYQQDDALYNRQLGYPYKTGDLTKLGGENGNTNVLGSDGSISNFGATPATVVRPSNGSTSGVGPYQLLNPSAGCGSFGSLVSGYVAGTPAGSVSQACTQNSVGDYSQVSPSLRRINATIHTTVQVTPRSQLTAMFTYSQALSTYTGTPVSIRAQSQARAANTLSTPLPVYLPDGSLNPNNPFAAQGQAAQVIGMFSDIQRVNTQLSQNFRGSARYNGSAASNWGSDWNYDVNFVGMNTTLEQTILGVPTIRGIQDAIINGTYNFVDPSKNTNAVRKAIAPPNVMNARTQEYSGEMSLSKGLFKLPGGTVDLAIGGNVRYESLNDPSANPYDPSDPTAQYTGAINPFNAQGSRWVESGFFELGLPFHKMLSGNIAGRYDHYSEGFSHYTPKAGLIFTPVKQFSLRGTFSRGFRVPSFAETGGSNVGYTTYQPRNQAWLNQHLNPNGTPDTYAQSYSIGSNVAGNPNLKPEIATNFTGGALIKPTDWLNFSFDYYYIKKSNYIAPNPVSTTSVAEAYLAGEALPAGVSVTPEIVDSQHPDAPPRPALINLGYLNTNKVVTDGVDFSISATSRLPGVLHDVRWISTGRATYVHSFNLTTPDGQVQHYAGTIGPYGAVSASGTPRWRANWSNTFIYKSLAVTPTVYYTSGYKTVAEDQTGAGTRNTCSSFASIQQAYTPNQCHTKAFWDVDLNVNYRISDRWSVYANVYNLLGFKSPYDFATYGSYLYNSAWSQKGLVLRSFHFGVNVSL